MVNVWWQRKMPVYECDGATGMVHKPLADKSALAQLDHGKASLNVFLQVVEPHSLTHCSHHVIKLLPRPPPPLLPLFNSLSSGSDDCISLLCCSPRADAERCRTVATIYALS